MENLKPDSIVIRDLSVDYVDRKPALTTLHDMNFSVKRNEFVSIIGPSGCGKSTLFNLIGDLIDHERIKVQGKIEVLGGSPEIARKNRRLGVIFQKPTLLEWRNIEKNIALPLEIMNIDGQAREKKVAELLRLVGLEKYAKFNPSQLSGGMQQKVSIGRALAYDPEILLMDEPFGALDEINRDKMNQELIKIWSETKKTILFVTHSIAEAVFLSQKIIVMSGHPGRVKKIIEIDLPYPREKSEDKEIFYKYVIQIRKLLKDE